MNRNTEVEKKTDQTVIGWEPACDSGGLKLLLDSNREKDEWSLIMPWYGEKDLRSHEWPMSYFFSLSPLLHPPTPLSPLPHRNISTWSGFDQRDLTAHQLGFPEEFPPDWYPVDVHLAPIDFPFPDTPSPTEPTQLAREGLCLLICFKPIDRIGMVFLLFWIYSHSVTLFTCLLMYDPIPPCPPFP